jgi:Sulfatase
MNQACKASVADWPVSVGKSARLGLCTGAVPAMQTHRAYRDAILALSLAHLCYLKLWSALLVYGRADVFFMKDPPSRVAVAALLVNTLLLASVLWGAIRVARVEPTGVLFRVATAILVATGLGLLNAVRETLSTVVSLPFLRFELFSMLGRKGTVLAVALALCAILYAASRHPRRLLQWLLAPLLAFSVLVPITFTCAIWALMVRNDLAFAEPTQAPLLTPTHPQRALWIIFDEWDQRLSFDERPAGVNLPELDRFRQSALFASHAYPPAPDTIPSIPSLLAGRKIAEAHPTGPGALQLTFAGSSEKVLWGTEPNIISRARQNGFNVAIVGWYLPYCRVFRESVSLCSWMEMPLQNNSLGNGFQQVTVNELRSLIETNLLSPFGQSLPTAHQARAYYAAVEKAVAAVANPAIGLTIVHLPATHLPYFYDRFTNRPSGSNSLIGGYPDGLVLADWTLARIRRAMEERNLWDDATVLLSSDHSFRHSAAFDGKIDHRIPFLLKMPGQQAAANYDAEFNTVLSADLLWAALTGALSRDSDVPGWIDHYRGSTRN